MGGAIAAIEAGFQQRSIQDAAYRAQRDIESGDSVVVGVNRYQDDDGGVAAHHAHRPGRGGRPGRPPAGVP